tara:strand:+ start:481 stop:780 length:300 start_codon:yes stop_codon:yes gene_type:complete
MRNAKSFITENEKYLLEAILVMSFDSLSIDAKFVCYLVNESDFIEILMGEIAQSIDSLPTKVDSLDNMGNFDIKKQLNKVGKLLISEQLANIFQSCKLI